METVVYPNWGTRNSTVSFRAAGSLTARLFQDYFEVSANTSYPFRAISIGPDPVPPVDLLWYQSLSYGWSLSFDPPWIFTPGPLHLAPRIDLFFSKQQQLGGPGIDGANAGVNFSTPF